MKQFLMCSPDFFEVNYSINPWMKESIGKVNTSLAYKQWQDLHKIISSSASVVLLDGAKSGLPDLVFTANAASISQGKALVSYFAKPERQPESAINAAEFRRLGLEVDSEMVEDKVLFEGAGDALMSLDENGNKVVFFGFGHRSELAASAKLKEFFNTQVITLELVDDKFYHLDTCLCPLSDGWCIVWDKAFSKESMQKLKNHFKNKLIYLTQADALSFCANAVEFCDKKIVLNEASDHFCSTMRHRGFEVVQTPLSEFLLSGGSAKCLTLELGV